MLKLCHDMTKEDWEVFNGCSSEEQQAFWAFNRESELEEDFQKFMNSPFDSLRSEYRDRKYNREDAIKIQKKIEERLGVTDPEGEMPDEAWRQSNWCAE